VTDENLQRLRTRTNVAPARVRMAQWVESRRIQIFITAVIVLNAFVLGLETNAQVMARYGAALVAIDRACLAVFLAEISVKLFAYRTLFWRSGWNVFDALVIGVALIPGAGPWAVLRSLRVLRVLRLLTVVPALRKVVAAFLHSIPGLSGVVAVMGIFFYTAGVLATRLFGESHPEWFGTLGRSLYSLFQIMTLESWSMGIVRPLMQVHPWAWAFFVPFIVIATFTILNLFIGIIVSTMQELAITPDPQAVNPEIRALLQRIDGDLRQLSVQVEEQLRRNQNARDFKPDL
jgi:voltage-gated sodium channel